MIFFICFAIHLLLYPLLVILEYNVLIHQVRYTLLSIAYLSLILHAYHVYNDKGSRIAKWIGISVFVVLQIIILLWQPLPEDASETILGIQNSHPLDILPLNRLGAGLMVNDIVIHSTSFPLFTNIFFLYSTILFVYSHYRVELVVRYPNIKRANLLWLIIGILNVITILFLIFWFMGDYTNLFVYMLMVLNMVLIIINTLYFPESMLISHIQITRAAKLYKKVQSLEANTLPNKTNIRKIADYISSLPSDLFID